MDEVATPSPAATPTKGGTVEPANRAAVAKERFQTPREEPAERYEMRDPFAETKYRSNSFEQMAAMAEQLGSSRFTAIAADGKRTPVIKAHGEWLRGPQLPALLQAPIEHIQDEPEPAGKKQRAERAKSPAVTPQLETKAVAKIEAEADRQALVAKLEATLGERYLIKQAPVSVGNLKVGRVEYRFRGDTSRVAFTESTFKLVTDTNSPSVARSMVDVAQARNWQGLRISGNEDFRRLVWLEASVRGVKALGYEPNPADLEVLRREREARQLNRIEAVRETSPAQAAPASTAAEKASVRGNGGRKAVIAAMEAVLVAKGVPEKKREAVLAAASEQLAQRARAGQVPKVKIYDKTAPLQRHAMAPVQEVARSRERVGPTLAR